MFAIAALGALASSLVVQADPVGYLSVRCGDTPMLVAVDGKTAGSCPLDSIPLAPGVHVVEGWPSEGRRFTATALTRRVQIVAGALTSVDLSALRRIRIETEPFGAMVTREGTLLGSTPLTVSVSSEDPPLLVELEGYEPITLSAHSLSQDQPLKRLVLKPTAGVRSTSRLSERGPSRPDGLGAGTILKGMAVIGAITAAVVFKERADSEYEEYLTTGDLNEMDRHFERAQRLDSWAVASWIAGELALGLLVYDLLRDEGENQAPERASR